jgi:imidazolonepropionase-like amidohydrolase
VDEAHRLRLWAASHSYGGDGLKWALEAGVYDIQRAMAVNDEDIQTFRQKNLPMTATTLDQRQHEREDLKRFAPHSRCRLVEQTWKKMLAARVTLGFGCGSAPRPGRIYNSACNCSLGAPAEMFPLFVKWGTTPAYASRMATTVNAQIIHMQDTWGTIEKAQVRRSYCSFGKPVGRHHRDATSKIRNEGRRNCTKTIWVQMPWYFPDYIVKPSGAASLTFSNTRADR